MRCQNDDPKACIHLNLLSVTAEFEVKLWASGAQIFFHQRYLCPTANIPLQVFSPRRGHWHILTHVIQGEKPPPKWDARVIWAKLWASYIGQSFSARLLLYLSLYFLKFPEARQCKIAANWEYEFCVLIWIKKINKFFGQENQITCIILWVHIFIHQFMFQYRNHKLATKFGKFNLLAWFDYFKMGLSHGFIDWSLLMALILVCILWGFWNAWGHTAGRVNLRQNHPTNTPHGITPWRPLKKMHF